MDAKLACLLLAGLLQGTPALARTAECTANSPNHTVAVLELFTSEGCNSCPPADRWLSSLRDAPGNTGKLIPLALHVDYWDYIGWKDPFARPAFAERQREMSLQAGSKVVYTPQFFIQGRPYKASATTPALAGELTALNQRPPGADIALSLAPAANNNAQRMLERDVDNLADYFGQFAPALLQTRYGPEIWALYENGALHPESELTGTFEEAETAVNLDEVMEVIDAAQHEEDVRQAGRALAAAAEQPADDDI